MFSQLANDRQRSWQRICVLIMRSRKKTSINGFEKEQNHGGRRRDCFSLFYIGNSQIYWFYVVFRYSVFFFLLNIFGIILSSTIKTIVFSLWMSAKRGRCKLQAPIKNGNFGSKHTHLCGFWLGVSFLSHVTKHRSPLRLARTHLRKKVTTLHSFTVSIS